MIQRHEDPEYWWWDYSCPHCDTEYQATGDYETDQGEQECKVCKKTFYIEIEYEPSYNVRKEE